MDEEITIINTNTRNEKIIKFFLNNKKRFIIIISIICICLVGYYSFDVIQKRNKIELANQFNSTIIAFKVDEEEKTINELINIINKQDTTYSPLALYFLIDNNLIENKEKINNLFDILINKTNLDKEIKNLMIYKKALYNSDSIDENDNVLLIDDLIATGGTAGAAAKLVEISKGKVSGFIFVINLFDLGGSDNLIKMGYKIENLIDFPGH